ncbi:MAG: hypothetical protein MJE63_07510 [Proteobacteria bacterium]|nr:hypothetical protein [Pseudomonadota bacterium]
MNPKKPNRKMATNCRLVKLIFFLLLNMIAIASPAAESTMRPVYSLENLNMEVIKKETYNVPDNLGIEVFPVLVDGAIGTTYNNSISLIHFNNKTMKIEVLKKDFSDYVEGVQAFLPPFSNHYIGYIQTRRFLLFDLVNAKHKYYNIINTIKEHLIDVNVYGHSSKQFVFKTHKSSRIDGKKHDEFTLKAIDLSSGKPEVMRNYSLSSKGKNRLLWEYTFDDKLFLLDVETKKYSVIDSTFSPTTHPLIEILNEHKDFKKSIVTSFRIHPKLPFAIIRGKTKFWVIDWKERNPNLIPIIYRPEQASSFSISQNGKWLFVSKTKSLGLQGKIQKEYFAMPIDDKLPHYLGDPVSLGVDDKPDEVVWTNNPTSLVAVNQFSHITRWVLEDQ